MDSMDNTSLMRHENQLPYEDAGFMALLVGALKRRCREGERVIWRAPFRWHDDAGVLSNRYESHSLGSVARSLQSEVIWDLGHAAIIRHDPTMTLCNYCQTYRREKCGDDFCEFQGGQK